MTANTAQRSHRSQAAELQLSDKEFDLLRKIVYDQSGITLSDAKKQMLRRRVQKRIIELGLDSVAAYCERLTEKNSNELTQFINEVTTNLTYFFREIHHFEYLQRTVLPEIRASKGKKRLRIWSAGCSTGEEPHSLAVVLKETERDFAGWDAKILASDLSYDVLDACRQGIYDISQIQEHTDPQRIKKWFAGNEKKMTVSPLLQELIIFNQLNLMDAWPMKQKFDVIFCRNVMIYFDKPTKQRLVNRFADILTDNGHLFVGHSESLMNISDRFELIHKTTYRKNC